MRAGFQAEARTMVRPVAPRWSRPPRDLRPFGMQGDHRMLALPRPWPGSAVPHALRGPPDVPTPHPAADPPRAPRPGAVRPPGPPAQEGRPPRPGRATPELAVARRPDHPRGARHRPRDRGRRPRPEALRRLGHPGD